MIRLMASVVSLAICVTTTPGCASQCPSSGEMASLQSGWATSHKRVAGPTDHDSACRALSAALVKSVMVRRMAAACAAEAGREPNVDALDAEINAFNDLLAAECRG